MYAFKKNQVIVVALVVMIMIAGYLSYNTGNGSEENNFVMQEGITGEEFELGALVPNDDAIDTNAEVKDEKGDKENKVSEKKPDEKAPEEKKADEAALVSTEKSADPGEAIFVQSNAVASEFFAEAKLERENARAKSSDVLFQLMGNKDTPKNEKEEAAQTILELTDRIEKEALAEAMIESKGYKEVFVRINNETVDVIVDKTSITDAQAAQIADVIKRTTGISEDHLTISFLKSKK